MPGTNLNNLDAYNEVATTLGGAGGDLNDINTVNAIAVLEGSAGGHLNMIDALNAIELNALGSGGHLNTLDALNSIVVLKGGVGGHENDLDAINEWVDNVFVGLIDAFPPSAASWGVRRLTVAYTGPILRVRRSSDNAEQDIGYDGIGDLDTAALSSFVGANSAFIVRWYDQSGNGHDLSQATATAQPRIMNAGTIDVDPGNGRPIAVFDGTDDEVETAANFVGDAGFDGDYTLTLSMVFVKSITTATGILTFSDKNEGGGYFLNRSWEHNAREALHPTLVGSFENVIYRKATGTLDPEGIFLRSNQQVQATGYSGVSPETFTPNNPSAGTFIFGQWSDIFGDCKISEVILWTEVFNAAQALSIETNQQAYYGF